MEKFSIVPDEVREAWNRCHGAFYQVRREDLAWNLEEQTILKFEAARLGEVPVLWARTSAQGASLGVLEHGLWLSLHGEVSSGSEAMFAEAIEAYAVQVGAKRVAVASDEFHFLPGVPVNEGNGEALVAEFERRGFKTAGCVDFVGRMGNLKCEAYVTEVRADAESRGWTLSELEGDADRKDLTVFMEREFPGRWAREWEIWTERKDTGRAFWNLLRDEKKRLVGFSRLAVRGKVKPLTEGWNPGAIRLPLASGAAARDSDSCLGPIGIAASERGRGAGKVLLGLSLHKLSLCGAELVCIDWTNAFNYYTPLGFEIVRRYKSVWKEF